MQLYLEKTNTLIQDALLPLANLHLLLLPDSHQFREQPAPGWEKSKSKSDFPTECLRCSLKEHSNQRSSSVSALLHYSDLPLPPCNVLPGLQQDPSDAEIQTNAGSRLQKIIGIL